MANKKLLEELRRLTPDFQVNEDDEEDHEPSVKDIIPQEDRYHDDEEDHEPEDDYSDDEDADEYEEDEESGEEDEEGEPKDIHAVHILKSAYNSSEDDVKDAIISLARLIVENDIKPEAIEQFLDDVDVDHDEEAEGHDDEYTEEDEYEEPSEEENESYDGDDYEKALEEEYGDSIGKVSFLNESIAYDEFDSTDFGDMLE